MTRRNCVVGFVLIATIGLSSAQADGLPAAAADAEAAFGRLKTLVGAWEADTSAGKAQLTYELIAGGSALLERESGANRPAMLTLYHRDGDRLLLTHYCMVGNQPRMQARAFDAKAGELAFEFLERRAST